MLAPSAPLADLSNMQMGGQLPLHFGLPHHHHLAASLPIGPFAFGAPQQLQPGQQLSAEEAFAAGMAGQQVRLFTSFF